MAKLITVSKIASQVENPSLFDTLRDVRTEVNAALTDLQAQVDVLGGGSSSAVGSARALFIQTADSQTVAGNATTLFGTGVGSLTIPAGTLKNIGDTIRIEINGRGGVSDSANSAKTLALYLNGALVLSRLSIAAYMNLTNQGWQVRLDITCRTVGASGTVAFGGYFRPESTAGSDTTLTSGIPPTINTLAPITLDVRYNNNQITGYLITTTAVVSLLSV